MNLLIFHMHDMGRYCSPYGYALPTPHMDAFARGASVFHNLHGQSPTCSPSRAAMLTGRTAHESGMTGLLHRGFSLKDPSRHLGAVLEANGFETAMAGVQHEFRTEEGRVIPDQHILPSEQTRDPRTPMANIDDCPSKSFLMEHGLGLDTLRAPVELYDLYNDPNEQNNLAASEAHQDVLRDLSERLQAWMEKTDDPLRNGTVPLPPAPPRLNSRSQLSPGDTPLYDRIVN